MATERLRVKLTLAQAEQVEWAIEPMADHWCTEDGAATRDGQLYPESDLPTLGPLDGKRGPQQTARLLTLSPVEEINDDLLYRLRDQLPDMTRQSDEWESDRPACRRVLTAASNAVLRIRHRLRHG